MGNPVTPEVKCYAGSTYPERPRTFVWEGQEYTVLEIVHRRREPDGVGFFVRCAPGDHFFDLFYRHQEELWHIQPKGYDIIRVRPQPKPPIQGE